MAFTEYYVPDYGNKDDDKRCHHYKQGYDYGLGIVQELNTLGACFLEGAE